MRRKNEKDQLAEFALCVMSFIRDKIVEQGDNPSFLDVEIDYEKASLSGVRMAAQDMVDWCQDLTHSDIKILDLRLAQSGLPTITNMRDKAYRRAFSVISNGSIRNDEDYYLLNEYASNLADGSFSNDDRQKMDELLADYKPTSPS